MTAIESNEIEIIGQWHRKDDKIIADQNTKRIEWLVETYLREISGGGWETLFQDQHDGRYWELTYPHGEWHGGGPPKLTLLSMVEVKNKYNIK